MRYDHMNFDSYDHEFQTWIHVCAYIYKILIGVSFFICTSLMVVTLE